MGKKAHNIDCIHTDDEIDEVCWKPYGDYFCSLPEGHEGPHVACTSQKCGLELWKNE